jgi:hypothetical protein
MAVNEYQLQKEAGALFDEQNLFPEKPEYAKTITVAAPTLIEHRDQGGIWVQPSRYGGGELRGTLQDKALSIALDLEHLRLLEAEVKRVIQTLEQMAEYEAKVKAANAKYDEEHRDWIRSRQSFITAHVETAKEEAKREARRLANLAKKEQERSVADNATDNSGQE